MMGGQEQLSRLICVLSSLVLNILHAPHIAITASSSTARAVAGGRRSQVSPAGFASLLLGAALALTICRSVTFVIGFILMPWVLSIVMFFYFVGFLTNLSGLGRAGGPLP